MTSENTFALLVGVCHYPQWQGAGLRGAVNDARAWRALCLETLGVPAENVRLLCSPFEGPGEGEAPATEAELRAGVAWLGDQLAATTAAGAAPSGLIVFCGHGAALPDAGAGPLGTGVGLCTADLRRTEAGEVAGVVPVAALQAALAERCRAGGEDPQRSWPRDVTVVLDCCYSAVPGLTLAEPLQSAPKPDQAQNLCRYLLACDPWSVSYELQSLGLWHGAFSYTLLTLLEQWTTRAEGGTAWFDVSAQTLIQRSAAMLEQLGLQQQPTLAGAPRVGMVPFLRPGLTVGPNLCAPFPNRRRPKAQIDTGWTGFSAFSLSVTATVGGVNTTVVVAIVVVPGSSCTTFTQNGETVSMSPGQELWFPIPGALSKAPSKITSATFKACVINGTWPGSNNLFNKMLISAGYTSLGSKSSVLPPWVCLADFGPFLNTSASCPTGQVGSHLLVNSSSTADQSAATALRVGFTTLTVNGATTYTLAWLAWGAAYQGPVRLFHNLSAAGNSVSFATGTAPDGSYYWGADLTVPAPPTISAVATNTATSGGFLSGQTFAYLTSCVDSAGNESCIGAGDWVEAVSGMGSVTLTISVPSSTSSFTPQAVRLYRVTGLSDVVSSVVWLGAIPIPTDATSVTFIDD
ncbi:MAG: hypothetical protein RIT28_1873 [Pseudomonadota bacterium]